MSKKIIFGLVLIAGLVALIPMAVASASATSTAGAGGTEAAKIACIGAAVNIRESALDSGLGVYMKASTVAYATRAKALKQAYAITTYAGAHAAAQAAWSAFGASFKVAVANWTTVKSSTWAKFDTAVLACKAPTSTSDAADVVSGF